MTLQELFQQIPCRTKNMTNAEEKDIKLTGIESSKSANDDYFKTHAIYSEFAKNRKSLT